MYKRIVSFEKRKEDANKILAKYPDRIPIICYKDDRSTIPPIDKSKYLVPRDFTTGQFIYVIRKRIHIPPHKSMYMFVQNIIPPTNSLIETIYEQYQDKDGFLYMMYSGENTFG